MEVYESSKFTFAGIFAGIPRNTYVIPSISISCLKTPGNPWKIHYRNVKPWQIVTANFHTNTNSKSSNWKFAWNVIWKFIIFVFCFKVAVRFQSNTNLIRLNDTRTFCCWPLCAGDSCQSRRFQHLESVEWIAYFWDAWWMTFKLSAFRNEWDFIKLTLFSSCRCDRSTEIAKTI